MGIRRKMLRYISCLIFLATIFVVNARLRCFTTYDSKDPNKPCIFPFKHKGKSYFGCPPDPDVAGRHWCSTEVDNRGNHVSGKGHYGFCDESCPRHKERTTNKAKNRFRG